MSLHQLTASLLILLSFSSPFGYCKTPLVFTNQFAIHVPAGKDQADAIAEKHGFVNIGQIGSLKEYYLLEHKHVHKRSLTASQDHNEKLINEPEVKWVQQQHEKRRLKRDVFSAGYPAGFADEFTSLFSGATRSGQPYPDPLYKEEWYLNGGAKDGYDMNVRPAWSKGYTGKGVVVSILDDGIQTNHPDLAENYDPAASTDINDNDDDPMPRDNGDNKHGTRCAGEVAAVAYNSFCGIGVAYNASIGGVRMLDGSVNDAVEARALSLNPDHIDIYSASWGPEDDGKTVDGPGPLARRAFINGVTTGRKGKGSIFVWASGNGGRHTDSCNCDGYTNSIFTLSISSATQGGYKPWYLEECSSTLATTYSSGTPGHDKSIATVDMDGKLRPDHICTVEHTGTSASAPLASGLCALALEANPELTWRDMQHIVVMTSNPEPLMKEAGWITNGVNRKVSHKFGYGLMDGGAMVSLAEQWTSVPPQHICKSQEVREDRQIDQSYGSILTTAVDASGCTGTVNEVRFVEHVQCKISLRFFPRGNLRIVLTSPSGTPSTLLMERPRDVVSSNFDDWPFLSVHYWGENPTGRWTLHIINAGNRHVNQPGILRKWQLIFYGTVSNPVRLRRPGQQISFPSAAPASLNPIFQSSQDFFSGAFRHLPNIFTAAGSETKATKVAIDGINPNINELSDNGCHESCSTCAGPGQDSCLSCAPGLLYVTDLGLCLQRCPDGYFEDVTKNACIGCQGNCASCPEGPNICSSCDHHLILHNNTCITSCPEKTFETDDSMCESCHDSCETCTRGGESDCVTCPGGIEAGGDGYCPPRCPRECSACNEDGKCLTCKSGVLVDEETGICPTTCRPGEYMNDQVCEPCTDFTNCTKCPSGTLIHNRTCVASCSSGYYVDIGWCRPCASHCAACVGGREDECVICDKGYLLSRGVCLSSCPEDTYVSPTGCSKCHHFCTSCSGEGPYACTSCAVGRYLDAAEKVCMPCQPCNSTNKYQCCHCDPETGKCHIPSGKRRMAAGAARMVAMESTIQEAVVQPEPPRFGHVTMGAVLACASTLVLFAVVFLILQKRSKSAERLRGYTKVPVREMRFTPLPEIQRHSRILFREDDSDEDEIVLATNS